MAKQITIWYAQDRAWWQKNNPGCDVEKWPEYDSIRAGIEQAGMSPDDIFAFCYSKDGDDLDKKLKVYSTPQLLFAFPDPRKPFSPNSGVSEFVFVAKLVKEQISAANVALMLKVVKTLDFRANGDSVTWYNTEFGSDVGISSRNDSPGSGLLGLNPLREVTLEGGNFKLDAFLQSVKKLAPWLIVGAVLFSQSKKK